MNRLFQRDHAGGAPPLDHAPWRRVTAAPGRASNIAPRSQNCTFSMYFHFQIDIILHPAPFCPLTQSLVRLMAKVSDHPLINTRRPAIDFNCPPGSFRLPVNQSLADFDDHECSGLVCGRGCLRPEHLGRGKEDWCVVASNPMVRASRAS